LKWIDVNDERYGTGRGYGRGISIFKPPFITNIELRSELKWVIK